MTRGLYFHIPYCARRCDYCDFFVVVPGSGDEAGAQDRFVPWLVRDLEQAAARLGTRPPLDTIYFGGGTPSILDPDALASLLRAARRLFEVDREAEVTLEANPETVTAEAASAWREAGVNRVSLGVQSLSDEVLRPRGRLHSADGAIEAARRVRDAGIPVLGIDLIAGLPGETPRSFASGLERALAAGPDHVSIYLLEMDESGKETPLARAVQEGRTAAPPEDETVACFAAACERLQAAGLPRYEISNFAREGMACRHNLKYWTSDEWLGVGPSAHSNLQGRRFGRPAGIDSWRAWVRGGGDPGSQDYTHAGAEARAREAFVLELRLARGVDLAAFASRWGWDPRDAHGGTLDEMEGAGLLRREGARVALTARGMLLSNDLFGRFL